MQKIREKLAEYPELVSWTLFILVGALLVFITNNFAALLAPFIIAYIAARVLHPMMDVINKKLHIPKAISTIICLILFTGLIVVVVWFFGHYLYEGVKYLIDTLSAESTINEFSTAVNNIIVSIETKFEFIDINLQSDELVGMFKDTLSSAIKFLSNFTINTAVKVPAILLSTIIGYVSTFYILYDYDKLRKVISTQFSEKTKKFINVINNQALTSFFKMIVSYIIISVVCFIELIVGFYIIGIEEATFLALIIAIVDVLPVVGSGTVLIPWAILSLILGNPLQAIGLGLLFAVITVVRQILEPRVVGKQVGLYPLTTVAALFIGLQLMGGMGLIVAPLYVIICKKLTEEGLLHLYKIPQAEEPPSVSKILKIDKLTNIANSAVNKFTKASENATKSEESEKSDM
ncbi:MAG: sporulation integral membrane protein YtvI [Agathobacter sp.]|nr:sporulation integral membrane protein YtvI [Agathobacter sp.]